MNIFVGNLSYDTTESQLQDLFTPFGEVKAVKLVTDNFTGRPRGFGFVEMQQQAEAEQAIAKLNGTMVNQRALVVNEARPKTSESRGSGSGSGGYGNRSRNRY